MTFSLRLLSLLLIPGFLLPTAAHPSADPAHRCPAGDEDYACGDSGFGGCPVSRCRRLLRQIAYASSEGEANRLRQAYHDQCVPDATCQSQWGRLQELQGKWTEMLRQVEGQCSPDIDMQALAQLPELEEKCRHSTASLHQQLRRLRCQILQGGRRDCPDQERLPCPVPPAAVKPLLNPDRRLCVYPERSPLPIYRCTGGTGRVTVGALCPSTEQAAEEAGGCTKLAQLDLSKLAEDVGVEDLTLLALLPDVKPSGSGWLDRLGGAAPTPGLRLSSLAAWTVAPRARLPSDASLFVIASDTSGLTYTGRFNGAGALRLRRAEGWTAEDLAAENLCSRSVSDCHHSDWRALQREALRADDGLRPLVRGRETTEADRRISVRCFARTSASADLEGVLCIRLLTEPPGRAHAGLEVNVEAWEPLRLDWFLAAGSLAPETLRPFAQWLADEPDAAPFYLLAIDDDRGTALAHRGALNVLEIVDGGVRQRPTSDLLAVLLRRWLATSAGSDLSAARALAAQQLRLPGALLLQDPTSSTPRRSCWLTEDDAVRCFEGEDVDHTLLDPWRFWGPAPDLEEQTAALRAALVGEADTPELPLTPPLEELIAGGEAAPVLDLPELGDTWLALRQRGAAEARDGACRIELGLQSHDGTTDLEVVALLDGDLPDTTACEAILAARYAPLRQALRHQLEHRQGQGPLRLISWAAEEDPTAPGISSLTFRDHQGEEHLLFFPHDPDAGAWGPYRWQCLTELADGEGYGRFSVDGHGVEDFVRCVFDPAHPCRQRRRKDPQLWLSNESQANPCLTAERKDNER